MSGDRWFRRLLRLLPEDFRADYGSEMTRVFHEERRDARTRMDVISIWGRSLRGLLAIGPREHGAQLAQDARYALRGMRRQPGFALVAVTTLALGLGANAAMFAAVHAVLLRPLPYGQPDRLVAVWNRWDGRPAARLSDPEFLDYAEQARSMALAALSTGAVNVVAGGEPERVQAGYVTANAFDVLGVLPLAGRGFEPGDDVPGAGPVVILTEGFWRRRLGGDPSAIGGSIRVDGVAHEVVGVLAASSSLPLAPGSSAGPDVVLPLALDRAAPRSRRGGHYLRAFGRLAPGASVTSASTEMAGIVARLARQYPDEHDQGNFAVVVRPLDDDLLGDARPVLVALGTIAALVLLLAGANVANLLLARGESRRRELAVRAALGAARFRLLRQLLTESTLLALCGATVGLLVAAWCQQLLSGLGDATLPRIGEASLGRPVLVFTAILSLATALFCGGIPALQALRTGGSESLKGGRGADGTRARIRRGLAIAQVAIAVVLLVAAALVIGSFARLSRVPTGLNADRVLTARVSLPESSYPGLAEITSFFERLIERVAALPGVERAGASSGLPLAVASGDWSFDIEGRPRTDGRYPGAADWYVVTPGYFEALHIPLQHGRFPAPSDTATAPRVVFVNQQTAATLFPGANPVGRRIRLTSTTGPEQPWRTIAGVVGDVRHRGLGSAPHPEIFLPYGQFLHFSAGVQARAMTLVVRTAGDPLDLAPALRRALQAIDPEIPAAQTRDMAAVVADSVSNRRVNATLVGLFGGLALGLATIGVYGVLSYGVARRTREMGVRQAMGATRGDILQLVVREGLELTGTGLAIGLAAALPAASQISGLLDTLRPHDPLAFASAAFILLAAGLVASVVPARRATRVDPAVALRSE
ncbi:MAG TPA: ABC transporter permease [Vicinamibacterales bacterium]|nr:ABC transporter permease [Vicinamibacterales bacterium]